MFDKYRHYRYQCITGVICLNNLATNGLYGLISINTGYIYGLLGTIYTEYTTTLYLLYIKYRLYIAGSNWLAHQLGRVGWHGLGCLGLGLLGLSCLWLGCLGLGLLWLAGSDWAGSGWAGMNWAGSGWLGLARIGILYIVGQHLWDSTAGHFFNQPRAERGAILYYYFRKHKNSIKKSKNAGNKNKFRKMCQPISASFVK